MTHMQEAVALNQGWFYHLCRWGHWAIFFAMAVACGMLAGPDIHPENAYFPMILSAGIVLFIEMCYLGMNRWRMSLKYLLLVTTYLAVTGGAAMTAFKLSRRLFADF
jgi:hypothetical protein